MNYIKPLWPSPLGRKGTAQVRTKWNRVIRFWYNKNFFFPSWNIICYYVSKPCKHRVRSVQVIAIIPETKDGGSDFQPPELDHKPSHKAVCFLSSQVFEPDPTRRCLNSRAFSEQGEIHSFETSPECHWLQSFGESYRKYSTEKTNLLLTYRCYSFNGIDRVPIIFRIWVGILVIWPRKSLTVSAS